MSMVVLLNKPYGVICQFSPSGEHRRLKDLVPLLDVYAAGRLDTDSEGLVVLTDDGVLQHRIADPRHKLAKTYFVEVEGVPDDTALAPLRTGVRVGDYVTRPAEAALTAPPDWLWPRVPPIRIRRAIPTSWLKLTLREGRNRQVRRMTAAVGFPTLRLIRYSIGPWTLAGISPGTWKTADASILRDNDTKNVTVNAGTSHSSRSSERPRPRKI